MTLLPSSDFGIRGEPGKQHALDERCAAPNCLRSAIHGHHLWSRSYLRGQPYEWVRLPDGTVVGNRVGLCVEHHEQVTGEIGGYRARIVFDQGIFWWEIRDELHRSLADPTSPVVQYSWKRVGPLTWQPPGVERREPLTERQVKKLEGILAREPDEAETCPTCGKPKHERKHKPGPKRTTKDWTLAVPNDAEVGAEILDGWADDIAVVLGFSDETSRLRRYHAVAVGLAWVIQNRETFVSDLVEAANA